MHAVVWLCLKSQIELLFGFAACCEDRQETVKIHTTGFSRVVPADPENSAVGSN